MTSLFDEGAAVEEPLKAFATLFVYIRSFSAKSSGLGSLESKLAAVQK